MTIEKLIFIAWICIGIYNIIKYQNSVSEVSEKKDKYWSGKRHLIFGVLTAISGFALLFRESFSEDVQDKIFAAIFVWFGLYGAITYKESGKEAIEYQKKQHKFFHMKFEASGNDVRYSQIGYLVVGIVFACFGLAKLFS